MDRISTLLLISLLLSCTSSPGEKRKQNNFIKTFEGEIGDKYEVVVKLRCENGLVSGNYYYKTKGQELEIKGEIKRNGEVSFKEFDDNGNQTGSFQGIIEGEKKITGNWSKPNGDNQMGFVLLETNTDYNSVLNDFQELKSIVGRYESPFNEGGVSYGTVIISNVRGDKFDFEITTAHEQGCTGEAKGTGTIAKNKNGKYSARDCKKLEFQFFSGEVRIKEDDCDLHGMRCYFSGTYHKKI